MQLELFSIRYFLLAVTPRFACIANKHQGALSIEVIHMVAFLISSFTRLNSFSCTSPQFYSLSFFIRFQIGKHSCARLGMISLNWLTAPPKNDLSCFKLVVFSLSEIPCKLRLIGATTCCDRFYRTHSMFLDAKAHLTIFKFVFASSNLFSICS